MSFKFSIGKRIGTGFGVLIFLVISVFFVTYQTLDKSIKINDEIATVNNPSLTALEELKFLAVRSKMLIFNWVYSQSNTNHPDKIKLVRLIELEYPTIKLKISKLASSWNEKDLKKINSLFEEIDALFEMHQEVMTYLPDFESYEEATNQFLANSMIGDDGDIYIKTNEIIFHLDELINIHKFQTDNATKKMQSSFNFLKTLAKYLGLALIIGGLLIAFYTTKSIVTPVNNLKHILLKLSKGIFPEKAIQARNDEIGEMTIALNRLVVGLKSTKDFANAVGSGKYNTNYKPLSNEDTLGIALLKMREDLEENERVLEKKVVERTKEVVKQKDEIEKQNEKISELYKEVTDSIKYAKRLQEAILPPDEFVKQALPTSFILYKPKDIVSGDFYWIEQKNNKTYFASVDCTGHGVPGAFMSILGNNALNEALRKYDTPAEILDDLNKGISEKLHNNALGSTTKDGMDLALCCYDASKKELQYAGAFNPLYFIRDNEITQLKADKFAIGTYFENPKQKYTNHIIQLQENDMVYIFSDGYADQFGGPKGKKLMYKNFRNYLLGIHSESLVNQKELLNNNIETWKGSLEQVDDILVIGMHV
ncbi:MAG: hypothetical protein CVT95_02015 [Bacteroidetes bacterium HGW-Bacteroidetes-12]|nr:MAG: hypothetical protein CVT95_02015 [Bacteroidetes bacterium HGW-Bacteroidetes-12]